MPLRQTVLGFALPQPLRVRAMQAPESRTKPPPGILAKTPRDSRREYTLATAGGAISAYCVGTQVRSDGWPGVASTETLLSAIDFNRLSSKRVSKKGLIRMGG